MLQARLFSLTVICWEFNSPHHLEGMLILGLPCPQPKTDLNSRWKPAFQMFFWSNSLKHLTFSSTEEIRNSAISLQDMSQIVKVLQPLKEVTTLMTEETNLTVCLIAPLYCHLIQDTKESIGESSMVRETEQAINRDSARSTTLRDSFLHSL